MPRIVLILTLLTLAAPPGWCPCSLWHEHDEAELASDDAVLTTIDDHQCHCQACPRGEETYGPVAVPTPNANSAKWPLPKDLFVADPTPPIAESNPTRDVANSASGHPCAPIHVLHCCLTI